MQKKQSITPIFICALAALFYVYDYFIQVSPSIITNQLMRDFNIAASGLGILSSCFFYTYAGMQIPAGILLDKFGARKILFIAVFISALGVLIFAETQQLFLAGLSRALVGFGSAFSFVGALFLAARWFAHKYFALIAGLVQFGGCLGSIFGAAPLSLAMNHFGWRNTLFVISLITFGMAFLFWLVIKDDTSTHQLEQKTYAYEWSQFFILFKNPQVLWLAFLGFVCWIPVAVVGALWGVPYLMNVYRITNTQAALMVAFFWLGLGISSPLLGWYSDYKKLRKPFFNLCFLLGFIGAWLLIFAPVLSIFWVIVGLCCLGICPGIQSLTFAVAKDFLPEKIFGTASGFINMAPIVGGALAQIFVGFLLDFLWDHQKIAGVPIYSVNAYQKGLLVLVFATLLGLAISIFKLKETYCGEAAEVSLRKVTDQMGSS